MLEKDEGVKVIPSIPASEGSQVTKEKVVGFYYELARN